MTLKNLNNFAKNMRRIRTTQPLHQHKQIEIIDDEVTMGDTSSQWSKTEQDGRVYLTRT